MRNLKDLNIGTVRTKESYYKDYFRGNIGLEIKKGPWLESCPIEISKHSFKESEDSFFIFIDIIEPIDFKSKFFELEMSNSVRRTNKWGSALMGGAKKLSDNDWKALGLPQ